MRESAYYKVNLWNPISWAFYLVAIIFQVFVSLFTNEKLQDTIRDLNKCYFKQKKLSNPNGFLLKLKLFKEV